MSEAIYNLVKSMNKNEKSRFSEGLRETKRIDYYRSILSAYSSANTYSADIDLKVFKHENKKLISDCKKHFKDSLNNFLISNKKYKTQVEAIRKNYEIGCMLMDRMLFKDALKVFNRAFHLAKSSSNHLFSLLLHERIMYIERHNDIVNYKVDPERIKLRHKLHLEEIESYRDYKLEYHRMWESLAMYYEKEGYKSYKRSDKVKFNTNPFKQAYFRAERKYFESLLEESIDARFICLSEILNLVHQNKDQLKYFPNAKKNFFSALDAYIYYGLQLGEYDKIEFALSQYDFYTKSSKREYVGALESKLISLSYYTFYTGKPKNVFKLEAEYNLSRSSKNTYLTRDCQFCLLQLNFLFRHWNKCNEYINQLEKVALIPDQSIQISFIKIIMALEMKEFVYVQSLMSTISLTKSNVDHLDFLKDFFSLLKLRLNNKEAQYIKKASTILLKSYGLTHGYLIYPEYIKRSITKKMKTKEKLSTT